MDTLTAIATSYGLDVLSSQLKSSATKYALLGASTHNRPDSEAAAFYEAVIETSYFDDNGVLTFVINLPKDRDFDKYLYAIVILDDTNQVIIKANTPKAALSTGIGGMITIKAAVRGQAGEIVFKAHDYITAPELEDLWMAPIYANAAATIRTSTRQINFHHRLLQLERRTDT